MQSRLMWRHTTQAAIFRLSRGKFRSSQEVRNDSEEPYTRRPPEQCGCWRTNRDILDGVRTILVRAGLPACFWTFACWHYCWADNTTERKGKPSSWYMAHGSEWNAARIPFGPAFLYYPAGAKQVQVGKMGPRGRTGIFAGHWIEPGYTRTGKYIVWDLTDFEGVDLRAHTSALKGNITLLEPHAISEVEPWDLENPHDRYFPLKTIQLSKSYI